MSTHSISFTEIYLNNYLIQKIYIYIYSVVQIIRAVFSPSCVVNNNDDCVTRLGQK